MYLLLLGLFLWFGLHLIPVLPRLDETIAARIGETSRLIVIAIGLVLSVFLMVYGWQAVGHSEPYWELPLWSRYVAVVLMLPAIVLFLASNIPTNLRRVIRHPQLTGFSLWAGLHLLVKGDLRAVLLFGGLLVWAFVMVLLSNLRDGHWKKPAPVGISGSILVYSVGVLAWVGLLWMHVWLFDVAPIPS